MFLKIDTDLNQAEASFQQNSRSEFTNKGQTNCNRPIGAKPSLISTTTTMIVEFSVTLIRIQVTRNCVFREQGTLNVQCVLAAVPPRALRSRRRAFAVSGA